MTAQLTLDGREVENDAVSPPRRLCRPITETQRAVLAHIAKHGYITPKDAGLILYAANGDGEWRHKYASTDGTEVLKRMMRRGLIFRPERGRYEVTR